MSNKKKAIIAGVFIAIILSAFVFGFLKKQDDAVTATGMVEVTLADLTPKVSGYLVERDFVEGTQVTAGSIIAVIEKTDYQLQYQQTTEAHKSALAQLDDLLAGSRSQELDAKHAAMVSAKEAMDKASLDYNRFKQLHQSGAVSSQQLDGYYVAMTTNVGLYKEAQASYQLAVEGSRQDIIKAQRHTVEQLGYAMKLAGNNLEHTNLKAPVTGRILSKNYEVGEYIQQGAPIATIGDMSDCWVKIYIPSTHLGKIKLGQEAEVKIDSHPNKIFTGYVKEIATHAEFTPRQTITKDERANLVFAVKVALDNKDGIFKPGMPAEVRLL